MTTATLPPLFDVERLGVIMAPEAGNPHEVEGVLNPAGATGPDGHYYLFPRIVGAGNYSRIGVVRVMRDVSGRPIGVERLGVALEPSAPYEIVEPGVGGCEDPRVTYLACANVYVMAYTALGPLGPRVALASSRDLLTWTRHGLVDFAAEDGASFNRYANKDALFFPEPVRAPDGRLALALMHRPIYETWDGVAGHACIALAPPPGVCDHRPSIWVSYCPLEDLGWLSGEETACVAQHRLVALPEAAWEEYRIGGGTVPVRTDEGWLTFYHGVELYADGGRCYQAGAMVLDREDPQYVVSRSLEPVFGPDTPEERVGVVNNVVFPTAIDERDGGYDVYYGMADSRIGVARVVARAAAAEEYAA